MCGVALRNKLSEDGTGLKLDYRILPKIRDDTYIVIPPSDEISDSASGTPVSVMGNASDYPFCGAAPSARHDPLPNQTRAQRQRVAAERKNKVAGRCGGAYAAI